MIEVEYTGTDGSVWDLRRGPVQITDGGIRGFGVIDVEYFTRQSPFLDGQQVTGFRMKPRPVFLPLLLGVDVFDEMEWLDLDRAWSAAHEIGEVGTLKVTVADGTSRTLGIRFKDDGGKVFDADPSTHAMYVVGYNYEADDPWWHGPLITESFGVDPDPQNFYGGNEVGLATPFYLSRSNTAASATFTNPGDVDAWPTYRVVGSITAFVFNVGGGIISGDDTKLPVAAGSTLTIETDPRRQIALLSNGSTVVRKTRQLTSAQWRRIPKGEAVALDLQVTGSGHVEVEVAPRYKKAW